MEHERESAPGWPAPIPALARTPDWVYYATNLRRAHGRITIEE